MHLGHRRDIIAVMKASSVSPTDVAWEDDQPVYRVYFWRRQTDDPSSGWESDEWEIADVADIDHVLDWARHTANGRQFVVYAVVHTAEKKGMVRLLGTDPAMPT